MFSSIKPKPSFDVLIVGSNTDMNFMRCNTLIQSGKILDCGEYDWLPASDEPDFFYQLDCEFRIVYASWMNADHAGFDGIITINNEYDADMDDGFGMLEIPLVRVFCSGQSSQPSQELSDLNKFDLITFCERISLFLPLILLLHALTGKDYSKEFVNRKKYLKDMYDNL